MSEEQVDDDRYTAPDGTLVRPEPFVGVLGTTTGTSVAKMKEAQGLDTGVEHNFGVTLALDNGEELALIFSAEYAEKLADELLAFGYGPGGSRR